METNKSVLGPSRKNTDQKYYHGDEWHTCFDEAEMVLEEHPECQIIEIGVLQRLPSVWAVRWVDCDGCSEVSEFETESAADSFAKTVHPS